jgi:hypothetical protein
MLFTKKKYFQARAGSKHNVDHAMSIALVGALQLGTAFGAGGSLLS